MRYAWLMLVVATTLHAQNVGWDAKTGVISYNGGGIEDRVTVRETVGPDLKTPVVEVFWQTWAEGKVHATGTSTFQKSQVKLFWFDGSDGNDFCSCRGVGFTCHINGGDGDDELTGGVNADRLWGEAGSDRLVGGPGIDTLVGGEGNDALIGEGYTDGVLTGVKPGNVYEDYNVLEDTRSLP